MGLMKKNWGVGGKGLNKPCIALGLGFSEAPRTGLSLLQLVTAQLSASLGAASSRGWMLHFSFFWVGFPPTSYSAWAAYCFPAVHGGFLVHVQHPSFYSGNNNNKKTPTTKPNSKALLGEICWSAEIKTFPQGGMMKLWQSPGRFLPKWPGGTCPTAKKGRCQVPSWGLCMSRALWLLIQGRLGTAPDLGTVKQFKLFFNYCASKVGSGLGSAENWLVWLWSSLNSFSVYWGEKPSGSVCICFDSLHQF